MVSLVSFDKKTREFTSFLAAVTLVQQLSLPVVALGQTADNKPHVVSSEAQTETEKHSESSNTKGLEGGSPEPKSVYYQNSVSYTSQNLRNLDSSERVPSATAKKKIAQTLPEDSARDAKELSEIDELTRKILLKEIELERFNLHYTQEVAKQGRWKGWRYGAVGEINAATGVAGSIISIYERGRHLHRPQGVVRRVQEQANLVPMYGSIIGATGAGLELSINQWHDLQARRKGFAPKAAHEKVKAIKADIDGMQARRDALIKDEENHPTLSCRVQVDRIEGKILEDLENQGLLEFARFQVRARKLLAFQQTQYLFDISKNVFNAIGCEEGFLALHKRDRRYNFKAGMMFLVSGGLYTVGPIASRLVAFGVGKYHQQKLRTTLEEAEAQEVAKLESDMNELDAVCKSSGTPADVLEQAIVRGELYGRHSKGFQDEIQRSQKANDTAKMIATQNIASGIYVGGSKIASGVLFTVPGARSAYNNGKTLRSSRVTNDLLFTSGVVGLPASTYAMLDTLRIQVKGELNRRKQKRENRLPSQLTAERLKQLDEMESRLLSKK